MRNGECDSFDSVKFTLGHLQLVNITRTSASKIEHKGETFISNLQMRKEGEGRRKE